jgi:hypothetical protein
MSQQYLVSGIDFTALTCISKSDVMQGIQAAQPYTVGKIGFVIASDSAPDVITNPEQEFFLWIETVVDVPSGNIYYYNGTSWQLWTVVDGSKLTNSSVTVSKLSLTGGNALDIMQINAGATAVAYVPVLTAIVNNTVPLAKLVGGGAGNFVMVSVSGTNQYYTPTQLSALFPTTSVSLTQLVNGGAGSDYILISINGVNTWYLASAISNFIATNTFPIAKLERTGGLVGQAIRINSAGNNWEFYSSPLIPIPVYGQFTMNVTVLSEVAAKIGTMSLALPSGYTSWDSCRVVFSTRIAIAFVASSINALTIHCGATTFAWVGNMPLNGFAAVSADDSITPTWVTEGVPTAHLTDNPLILDIYAGGTGIFDIVAERVAYVAAMATK